MDPRRGSWETEGSGGAGGQRPDPQPSAAGGASATHTTLQVSHLLTVCNSCLCCVPHRNPEDLSRMLRVVHGSEVTLNESLGSALVSGLAEEGRIKDIKVVLQKVGMLEEV